MRGGADLVKKIHSFNCAGSMRHAAHVPNVAAGAEQVAALLALVYLPYPALPCPTCPTCPTCSLCPAPYCTVLAPLTRHLPYLPTPVAEGMLDRSTWEAAREAAFEVPADEPPAPPAICRLTSLAYSPPVRAWTCACTCDTDVHEGGAGLHTGVQGVDCQISSGSRGGGHPQWERFPRPPARPRPGVGCRGIRYCRGAGKAIVQAGC